MPATIINVNAVEECTARALNYVSQQEDVLDQINTTVNTMENAWESDAQRAFAESFRASRDEILSFNESVTRSLQDMRNFVTDCVEVDELTARELRGVSW